MGGTACEATALGLSHRERVVREFGVYRTDFSPVSPQTCPLCPGLPEVLKAQNGFSRKTCQSLWLRHLPSDCPGGARGDLWLTRVQHGRG